MKKVIILISIMLTLTSLSFAQNGLNFDGNDDIVQTNYPGVLGVANRTFEAWVYVNSNAPASNLAILDYGLNAVGSRNTFLISSSRGLSFISGGTNANIGTGGGTIQLDQWVHVAFVLDNGTGYLYINGNQVMTGSLSTVNTPANNQTVRIGQRVSGGTIPFSGALDEIRIWNVARTAAQIQSNMNTEFCSPQPNLQLYLKLNEGIAGGLNTGITAATDDSGNGYTGTLSNFALSGNVSNWVTGTTLTINATNTFATFSASDCNSYTLPSGNLVTTSGMYMDTIPNTQCGDSILTVNVTINNNTSSSSALTVCDSYTDTNGDIYTASQIISYTLPNAAGCDSLVSLNLTVLNSSSSNITETACGDYVSPSGMIITTSQVFTDVIPNAAGCDSMITIDLTIVEIEDSVTSIFGEMIFSEEMDSNATFQWYECDANGNLTIVPNANSRVYAPGFFVGFLVVEITLNGCVDTSACTEFIDVSTKKQYLESLVNVFPNPNTGNFTIDLGAVYQDIQIEIYSLDGRIVNRQTFNNQQQIDAQIDAVSGLYQVKISTEKGTANKMILKE